MMRLSFAPRTAVFAVSGNFVALTVLEYKSFNRDHL